MGKYYNKTRRNWWIAMFVSIVAILLAEWLMRGYGVIHGGPFYEPNVMNWLYSFRFFTHLNMLMALIYASTKIIFISLNSKNQDKYKWLISNKITGGAMTLNLIVSLIVLFVLGPTEFFAGGEYTIPTKNHSSIAGGISIVTTHFILCPIIFVEGFIWLRGQRQGKYEKQGDFDLKAIAAPLLILSTYLIVVMIMGSFGYPYPYPSLNPEKLGWGGVAGCMIAMSAVSAISVFIVKRSMDKIYVEWNPKQINS